MLKQQVCKRCVMDNSADNTIVFDSNGICNYCNYALSRKDSVYFPNSEGKRKLESMIKLLKEEGKGKEFDCLMGISGGLDSAYLAYLGAKEWGLRILAVHIDDGFDTEIAQLNIENLCNKFNIKLIIEKPNKEQYMDLIKAFLRSGVPSIAIPQDNVLQACLKKYSKKYNLKYFLSGANFSLESILQRGNGHVAADGVHVRAIHNKFGQVPLTNLPIITLFDRYIGQKYITKINTLRPLDLIDYNRERAIRELKDNAGFNYYGGKHYESIFTKFVQVYYLPKKFGVDKRTSHYSSLIVTEQMTRKEALNELKKPLYTEEQMKEDIDFILAEIGMEKEEFEELMNVPGKPHDEYKMSVFVNFAGLARKFRKILGE
jgi:N-acetyl sugar amidotransferase